MRALALALALAFVSPPADAAKLSDATLPDTATVGGQTLVLNGLGLREKMFIDVYVGALYLPSKTRSEASAINDDVPKRIVMHFIYSKVTAAQMNEVWEEGLEKNPPSAAVKESFKRLEGMMVDVTAGEEIAFDYVPGTGTTVFAKGQTKGTIAGADFMKALWTIYLGPNPPTNNLKKGMLGG